MKLSWRNKTGMQKAIVISAAACILSFGLCSAGMLANSAGALSIDPITVFGIFGQIAIGAFAVTLILFAWNDYRSKRK